MSRRNEVLLVIALVAITMLAIVVDPALAESKVGKNLGDEVKSWASALLLGVAALVGIPALAKRDMSQSLVIALIAAVLGGFVFAQGTIKDVIEGLWKAVAG
jgi:cobalamin synthase